MPNYGSAKYWEKRYKEQKGKTFDWLEDYEGLKELFDKFLKKKDKILMLGCGNSELSEKMYNDGYKNIENIDISKEVIKQMKERNIDKPLMTWKLMDCLNMKYDDKSFDAIVDKSTIDAILCGDYSFYNTAKMMNEVQRVLKDKGVYFAVSYGKPESRIFHFKRKHLDFNLDCFILSFLNSF